MLTYEEYFRALLRKIINNPGFKRIFTYVPLYDIIQQKIHVIHVDDAVVESGVA